MTMKGDGGDKYKYHRSFSLDELDELFPRSPITEHLDDNCGGDDPGKDIAPGFWELVTVLATSATVLIFLGYGIWKIAAAWGA